MDPEARYNHVRRVILALVLCALVGGIFVVGMVVMNFFAKSHQESDTSSLTPPPQYASDSTAQQPGVPVQGSGVISESQVQVTGMPGQEVPADPQTAEKMRLLDSLNGQ